VEKTRLADEAIRISDQYDEMLEKEENAREDKLKVGSCCYTMSRSWGGYGVTRRRGVFDATLIPP
jgi:hypothetical protein